MAKKIFFIFVLAFILLPFQLNRVQAQIISDPGVGLNMTANIVPAFQAQANSGKSYGSDFLATKAGQIIGTVLSFIGVLFLILMIYAGILWMTASGNEQQITKAKDLLINAVIGIIIVFAAYALTTFLGAELLIK